MIESSLSVYAFSDAMDDVLIPQTPARLLWFIGCVPGVAYLLLPSRVDVFRQFQPGERRRSHKPDTTLDLTPIFGLQVAQCQPVKAFAVGDLQAAKGSTSELTNHSC
jgi:hypothetical protein